MVVAVAVFLVLFFVAILIVVLIVRFYGFRKHDISLALEGNKDLESLSYWHNSCRKEK
jgi:hypothetical protein